MSTTPVRVTQHCWGETEPGPRTLTTSWAMSKCLESWSLCQRCCCMLAADLEHEQGLAGAGVQDGAGGVTAGNCVWPLVQVAASAPLHRRAQPPATCYLYGLAAGTARAGGSPPGILTTTTPHVTARCFNHVFASPVPLVPESAPYPHPQLGRGAI